jgi:D-glycero-D-manno-heptose 1,7-bisphosphate phosphatase
MPNRAIFFDRDGVLNKDIHLLCKIDDVIIPPDTIDAFKLLSGVECKKIVVSNQTVISRGLASENEVDNINQHIDNAILTLTSCKIDRFYTCPHHPDATLEKYRKNCDCRKPKPGMLQEAAEDYDIDLTQSWMIGDRISDIIAGHRAGCRTILIQTGMHKEKPIISDDMDLSISPDYTCNNLHEAVLIIVKDWT